MRLVDDNDKEVDRLVGVKTKAQIEEFISQRMEELHGTKRYSSMTAQVLSIW